MNELGLEGLLRSDDEGRLSSSGADTAKEVVELGGLSEHVSLDIRVGSESSIVLGDGEKKECTITSVEAEDSALSESVLDGSDGALLVLLGVELHDGLHVLSWESDGDLDSTSNTTYMQLLDSLHKKLTTSLSSF